MGIDGRVDRDVQTTHIGGNLFNRAWLLADMTFDRQSPEPLESPDDYLHRYPRICAHIIAESLGYVTPSTAARILLDAHRGDENWCEWIFSCYDRDPRRAVRDSIRNRHYHDGYMASYRQALAIVRRRLETGEEPIFASWF